MTRTFSTAMALSLLLPLAACAACPGANGTAEKPATPPPAPYGALPSPAQIKHAEHPFYGFCHFTVDTFTNREWGLGTESEDVFNPTAFDADQIVNSVKAAGMTGLILTCKHHDGFCLWPTQTTGHSVAHSKWKDGKGDVVRAMSDACKKAGIEFGVYLSPWDRNNPAYGKPEYVAVYRAQMKELLTRYGPVFEVWMDGANGGTGYYKGKVGPVEFKGPLENRGIDRTKYYDWPTTWALMRQYQPGAILFSDAGPDSRWCGNESGHSPDPCWQTYTPHSRNGQGDPMPGFTHYQEGGPGHRDSTRWMPSEVDVSIRGGWFWHEHENMGVRPPQNLMDIYVGSVGRGATFNLNCPPDRRGRLHENDVESLKQLGEHLRGTFAKNLAHGAQTTASNIRGNDPLYGPQKLLDADLWSAWITDDAVKTPEVVLDLKGEQTFNLIRLREDIRLGQRVDGAAVDAWDAKADGGKGAWKEITKAQSIGSCRLWRVPQTTTAKVRLRVTAAAACPALSDFGLFLEPTFGPWIPPVGSDPKAAQKIGWKILSVSKESANAPAVQAIDGNPNSIWHTYLKEGESGLPQDFAVDMGKEKTLKGFTYLPRQDKTTNGMVDGYQFLVSTDGKTWKKAAEGEFGNLETNPIEQTVSFGAVKARYFKFVATHVIHGKHAVVAEVGVVE